MNKICHLVIIILFSTSSTKAADPACRTIFEVRSEHYFKENFKTDNEPVKDKKKYFRDILWLLKALRPELRKALSPINNDLGTRIELSQAYSFLRGVEGFELAQLENIRSIENAVIYGSTNVPLYSLIAQAMLIGSFSKNVWFRTPSISRSVYLKIFTYLRDHLPHEYTDNIHLVTDPSDLAYDQFNRIFVMGQNRQGTRSIRPPAELVVLTGNPETARTMIDRNIRNLSKVAETYGNYKQLFLGFLAGVNPAVVVPSAKTNLDFVVERLLFPLLVNAGQDCMNSDIVLVHESISKDLKKKIVEEAENLKVTQVTMVKDLNKLVAYREKYKKYLLNPQTAQIDLDARLVTPHIFSIPFHEFADLEIQEHFAPFITLINYRNVKELEHISLDRRIQKKAMSALIYGGNSLSRDIEEARNVFRQAQHFVTLNSDIYAETEMNLPFGGVGADSSMSVLAELESNGKVNVQTRNRPMLISKEMQNVFGTPVTLIKPESEVLKPLPNHFFPENIRQEDRDLTTLQEVGKKHGVFFSETTGLDDKLVGIKSVSPNSKKIEGVVLHTTDVYAIVPNDAKVKGERNPLLGDENLLKRIAQDKLAELQIARAADPTMIPQSRLHQELKDTLNLKQFENLKVKILMILKNDPKNPLLEILVQNLVQIYFSEIRKVAPNGAYLKNYGEYASGDLGTGVTTFSSSTLQIAKEFSLWIRERTQTMPTADYFSKETQKYLKRRTYSNFTLFVNKLLTDPDSIIVQDRIDLAQTRMGSPMEFRVDFIYGQAISARMRFGYEYYPEEMKKAMEIFNEFMRKCPPEIQTLSGGADLALTRDGRGIIFEFNFGGASGTLTAGYYPFESNLIFSKLLGSPTWLVAELERVALLPIEEQNRYILKQKNETPIWWRTKVADISQVEWAKVLRDKLLDKWASSPNPKSTKHELQTNIDKLLDGPNTKTQQEFGRLKDGAEDYIARILSKK
ncbi:MAG: hypothetical protein A4S09_00695 [Proteobacteria bacterium SG_bin7]|nr:MAG: hypothetical protein A4S09_00695 [Proteobacteria bacterium SG_bin7]